MKKQAEVYDHVIPEYGRRRLHMYADSIRELADSYRETSGMEVTYTDQEDRQEYLWQKRLEENKDLMAEHLSEMAQIMANVAEESRKLIPMGERRYHQIMRALKEVDIQVRDIYMLENEDNMVELALGLQGIKNSSMSAEEIGDLLSVVLSMRLTSVADNPYFVSKEWKSFYYVEEAAYHVLTGVAKAVKETEKISGDNYSFFEGKTGKLSVILSDGMGSGEKASNDSAMIVELMEKFMEAGFHVETAIQMINSSLIAGTEENNMSTLDLCRIDLYKGICEFVKIGSASSYLKRDHLVEPISAGNLPLGIFHKPDMEITSRSLLDNDYIIMVTDGVLDALSQGMGEEMLPELLSGLQLENPGEMANAVLNFAIHQCRGHIRDDMTVLVVGIWEKERETR